VSASLRLVLGDQLTRDSAALRDAVPGRDPILMAEVRAEASGVPQHRKKLVFFFAAMRRFAHNLAEEGFEVRYVRIDDPDNTQTLPGELARAVAALRPEAVVGLRCGDFGLDQALQHTALPVPVTFREDDRFICSHDRFSDWARGKRQLRMEFFYREMRRETGLLMDGAEPAGGQWNFDTENRARLPAKVVPPAPRWVSPDALTREVIADVERLFPTQFGDLDGFGFATSAADAEALFQRFLDDALPSFGRYQDAMALDTPWMWHAVIGLYLNIGFLDPLAVCRAAEARYRQGLAPLNSVEGFIRQILGWREYVRGIYWLEMPEYKARNALNADRALPEFYWTGDTDMRCMADAIGQTRREAYAHHIQRLMVTGNFALLAGIDPGEINAWYLAVYADALEWVELPNTHGMAIYADGGRMASKPYAASGKYIQNMSNYCASCRYDVREALGPTACPFNALYWRFIDRHADKFASNPRMSLPLRNLERMDPERRAALTAAGDAFLARIGATPINETPPRKDYS
jgi:deoxyribodipyrimidine photolyase-related protein